MLVAATCDYRSPIGSRLVPAPVRPARVILIIGKAGVMLCISECAQQTTGGPTTAAATFASHCSPGPQVAVPRRQSHSQQHARVAECVGFHPVQIKELGDALVIRLK